MHKLELSQRLSQRLSPQQIQFAKLLQIPTVELAARIQQELVDNPTLEVEEDNYDNEMDNSDNQIDSSDYEDQGDISEEDRDFDEYTNYDEFMGYKMQGDGHTHEDRQIVIKDTVHFRDDLIEQLGYLTLTEEERLIGEQIIGNIDEDGYMRRDLNVLANDFIFLYGKYIDIEVFDKMLKEIQKFEPRGIAARDLRECMLIQLHDAKSKDDKNDLIDYAELSINKHFDTFAKKHYQKLAEKMNISMAKLKEVLDVIKNLDPKPGKGHTAQFGDYITPDFSVHEDGGDFVITATKMGSRSLRVSKVYSDMLQSKDETTVKFVRQKINAAKWFINALEQREHTLLSTMNFIVEYQKDFFLTGDESKLKPLILKNIAEQVGLDISTISRIVSSKFVHTDFGVFKLKFFFSESLKNDEGRDVSSKEIKYHLKNTIEEEDKFSPYSDEQLENILKEKGYNVARRTIAKYREQMDIPTSRLRKAL